MFRINIAFTNISFDNNTELKQGVIDLLGTVAKQNISQDKNSSKNIFAITASILDKEKKIMTNLTVPESLVDREDVDFGLTKDALIQMANVSSYLHQNSKSDKNRSLEDAKKISDQIHTVARAMVKDTLSGEEGANITTSTFSISAQKVSINNTKGLNITCPSAKIALNSPISAPGLNGTEHTLIFGSTDPSLYPSNKSSSMKTDIIRFTLFNTSGEMALVENLTEPIGITFPAKKKITSSFVCKYWDEKNSTWSTHGVKSIKSETDNFITCNTSHLSDFAILDDASSDELNIAITDAVFWIMYCIIGIFGFIVFWEHIL